MNKKLIFCITTGRSGTALLATLLNTLPKDKVFTGHEEKPLFDDYLTEARNAPEVFYRYWIEKKLPDIKGHPQDIYIETSHVISKGFIEPLLFLSPDTRFIWLQRSLDEVANSMYSLDDIPGRSRTGIRYYFLPSENQLKIRNWGNRNLTDYQLCYWYCKEAWHRAEQLRKKLGNKVYPIQLEALKLRGYFQEMLYSLGLPYPENWEEYKTLCGVYVNQKLNRKARCIPPDAEYQRKEVDRLLCTG